MTLCGLIKKCSASFNEEYYTLLQIKRHGEFLPEQYVTSTCKKQYHLNLKNFLYDLKRHELVQVVWHDFIV